MYYLSIYSVICLRSFTKAWRAMLVALLLRIRDILQTLHCFINKTVSAAQNRDGSDAASNLSVKYFELYLHTYRISIASTSTYTSPLLYVRIAWQDWKGLLRMVGCLQHNQSFLLKACLSDWLYYYLCKGILALNEHKSTYAIFMQLLNIHLCILDKFWNNY